MEEEYGPFSWDCYYHEEKMQVIEELKHSLLYTSLELEKTVLSAQEELARKGDQLMHLKSLLTKTIKERDEAQANFETLMVEKFTFQQQIQASSLSSNMEDEPTLINDSSATGFSSSACDDENFLVPPGVEHIPQPPPPPPELLSVGVTEKSVMMNNKALPEKGKLLQAVMEAGPLLQTLLLAGPLPEWQHPPPQLNSIEIPPVTIFSSPNPQLLIHQDSCLGTSDCFGKKRGV